jgi:hypothetical protein
MPVQETIDGIDELRAAKLPVGGVVVNLTRRSDLDEDERDRALTGELPRAPIKEALSRVGVKASAPLVDSLLAEAREHAERRELEDEQRKRISGLDVPVFELPRLAGGTDLGGLYELAADLCRQGMA